MKAPDPDDVEQMLVDTWTDELAARIADQVAGPSNRGHVIRDVQPGALENKHQHEILIDHLVADELARETGVDIEWARQDSTWLIYDQVIELLRERWADGGALPVVPEHHRDEAHRLLTEELTLKAAEWAGCDVTATDTRPVPLVAGGHLRVDLEGLDHYLARFSEYGIRRNEYEAIHRLHAITQPPTLGT